MRVRLEDNSTHRFLVSSEEEPEKEYCVDLCEYPLGYKDGQLIYNGCCGLTAGRIHGCKNFIFVQEPRLKADNKLDVFGVTLHPVHRCKHIRAAREQALDMVLPALLKADPNQPEDLQC